MTAASKAMTEADHLGTKRETPLRREYIAAFVGPLHAQAGINYVQYGGGLA